MDKQTPPEDVGRIKRSALLMVLAAVAVIIAFGVIYFAREWDKPAKQDQGTDELSAKEGPVEYKGEWGGFFVAASKVTAACPASGPVSLLVKQNDEIGGFVALNGKTAQTAGRLGEQGAISGTWEASPVWKFSGKLSSDGTGSGSYDNGNGCFGSFNVKHQAAN